MLTCPKCGFENELGRIFCHQCGNKLDINSIKAPGQGGPKIRRRRTWTAGSVARRAVELLLLLLIAWAIYLACQVPDVKPIKPTNAELLAADDKRLALEHLVLGQRPGSLEITETDLNTLIGSFGFDKATGSGLEIVPLKFRTQLGDGDVELIYVGEIHFGSAFSKKLYLDYTGVPVVQDNFFEFHPVGAHVGRLPIHPVILSMTNFIQDRFLQLLVKLAHERDQLDKLSSITVKPGKAELRYIPPSQPPAGGKPNAR